MNPKLIATDLDGTLVNDRKISQNDKIVLRRLFSENIPVIPVTTRMRFSTAQILTDTSLFTQPLVCNNGARILKSGWEKIGSTKELVRKELDLDIAKKISKYADEQGYLMTTIFAEKKFWVKEKLKEKIHDEPNEITEFIENNTQALAKNTPISFMIHDDINEKEALKDMENFCEKNLKKRLTLHRHHKSNRWIGLTIYPKEVNKLDGVTSSQTPEGVGLPIHSP